MKKKNYEEMIAMTKKLIEQAQANKLWENIISVADGCPDDTIVHVHVSKRQKKMVIVDAELAKLSKISFTDIVDDEFCCDDDDTELPSQSHAGYNVGLHSKPKYIG